MPRKRQNFWPTNVGCVKLINRQVCIVSIVVSNKKVHLHEPQEKEDRKRKKTSSSLLDFHRPTGLSELDGALWILAEAVETSLHEKRIGITYTITNSYGVTSFLVGTMHIIDQESFNNKKVKELIRKCSRVYTEAGEHLFNEWPRCRKHNAQSNYPHFPFRYAYDVAITMEAENACIPIISLDEGIPFYDKLHAESQETLDTLGADYVEKQMMDYHEEVSRLGPSFLKTVEAWKQGNVVALQKIFRNQDLSLNELRRQKHWVKKLIPCLQMTQRPVAIAVGALHVIGENSLSESFQKAGFQVELLRDNSSH